MSTGSCKRKTWSLLPEVALVILFLISSLTAVAAEFDGNIVLGSPTDQSITANVLTATNQDIYLQYGTKTGEYSEQTPISTFLADTPDEIEISGLKPNTRYYYRLNYNEGGSEVLSTEEYSFHTQRMPGNRFIFGVQGDSHPERSPRDFIPELYDITLAKAKADGIDFFITTGDDFSIDSRYPNGLKKDDVFERYRIQRSHLGLIGNSAPVFLVNGNHEQGALYLYNDEDNHPKPGNPAVWVQNARNSYFSQPSPSNFYTGNDTEIEFIDKDLTGTWFAWQWGDALFVTLDPFWSSPAAVDNVFGAVRDSDNSKTKDKWDITLGDEQYQWLKETLEESSATFKFIFTHMMQGASRGGVENAKLFEWGGENRAGKYEFDSKRPGWETPLHQLMVDTNVTIFFHAHDHVWVKQELDGVVYQEVSSPADPDYALTNWTTAYTDESSVIFPNTGYTKVTVSADAVQVDYVRTYLPADENNDRTSGDIAYTYTIEAPDSQVPDKSVN